jgi:hypothetical protein
MRSKVMKNRPKIARIGTCLLARCSDGSAVVADDLPQLSKVLTPIEIDTYLTVLEKVAKSPSERRSPESKSILKEIKTARAKLGKLRFQP